MREPVHTFHAEQLERLADEVRADHESKLKRRRQRYAGMKTAQNRHAHKYKNAEYFFDGSRNVRKLSQAEIQQFTVYIQRLIEQKAIA